MKKAATMGGVLSILLGSMAVLVALSGAANAAAPKYHSFETCDTASTCQTGGDQNVIGTFVLQHPQSDEADWNVQNGQNAVINDVTITISDGSTIKPDPATGTYTYQHVNGNRLTRLDVFGDDPAPPTTTTSTTVAPTTSTTAAPTTSTTAAPTTTSTTAAPTTTTTAAPVTSTTVAPAGPSTTLPAGGVVGRVTTVTTAAPASKAPATTAVQANELPRTGVNTGRLALKGFALLLAGIVLTLVAQRDRLRSARSDNQ
ncbi:MAG TPA: hypothetical protein VLF41_00880 [Candidatus Nanoarchaeia archaeon]|nr:hypothetical protein [Candidatus Nanoarchaeia archaeon]